MLPAPLLQVNNKILVLVNHSWNTASGLKTIDRPEWDFFAFSGCLGLFRACFKKHEFVFLES